MTETPAKTTETKPAKKAPAKKAAPDKAPGITEGQMRYLHVLLKEVGMTDRADVLDWLTTLTGRTISSRSDLTSAEAQDAIDAALDTDDPLPASVHEAIVAVKRDLPAVGKHGRNVDQGYAFRSIDDVVNAIAPVLAKHGVYYLPQVEDMTISERPTRSGGSQVMAVARVRWQIVGPGGDDVEATTYGQGLDTSDKSINKAMTGAYKTFLTETFAIPFQQEEQDYISPQAGSIPDNTELLKRLDGYATTQGITRSEITAKWRAANGMLPVEALETMPSDRLYPLVRSIGAYLEQAGQQPDAAPSGA